MQIAASPQVVFSGRVICTPAWWEGLHHCLWEGLHHCLVGGAVHAGCCPRPHRDGSAPHDPALRNVLGVTQTFLQCMLSRWQIAHS